MGARVAYELALHIAETTGVQIQSLFVGGSLPPQRYGTLRIRKEDSGRFFRTLDVPAGLAADSAYMQWLSRIVEADTDLLLTYSPRHATKPGFPITAVAGEHDPIVSTQSVAQWQEATNGVFEMHVLPGKHMFLVESRQALLQLIAGAITAHLSS